MIEESHDGRPTIVATMTTTTITTIETTQHLQYGTPTATNNHRTPRTNKDNKGNDKPANNGNNTDDEDRQKQAATLKAAQSPMSKGRRKWTGIRTTVKVFGGFAGRGPASAEQSSGQEPEQAQAAAAAAKMTRTMSLFRRGKEAASPLGLTRAATLAHGPEA